MFDDNPDTKWFREFDALGVERVRGAVAGGWPRDKKQAARRWLERQDLKAWQAGRTDTPTERVTFKERLRSSKLWVYAVAGILLLIGLSRLFR
jgi:hypothetical protein